MTEVGLRFQSRGIEEAIDGEGVATSTEFVWARRLLKRLKHEVESIALRRLGRGAGRKPGTGPLEPWNRDPIARTAAKT